MQLSDGVYPANTEEEKAAIYRQRYEIYVEEMQRYREIADHGKRWLKEPVDDVSRIYYAVRETKVVGSIRLTLGLDAPISGGLIEKYGLQPFLEEVDHEALIVGERFMVDRAWRGSDVLFEMITAYIQLVNEHRIQLMIGDCEPHLLNVYQALGFRPYGAQNINSADAGYLIPLVIVAEDMVYLRQLHSPLTRVMSDFGANSLIPDSAKQLVTKPASITSERLVEIADYWQEVYDALEALEARRISVFDGMSDEQAQLCLSKSTIIECCPGDRILMKGNTAQNLFVLLSGTLEVRDDNNVLAVIEPGEVFGEMAFLLGRPRTADVYAADGARIVSFSESVIRGLTESNAAAAAAALFMTNVSKMLCWRLVRDG